jgi:hypothetical protein
MTTFTKYEFIVCKFVNEDRFFIRKTSINDIYYTDITHHPKKCFDEWGISHNHTSFSKIFWFSLLNCTQTAVAEAQTLEDLLEDLRLELAEYFI